LRIQEVYLFTTDESRVAQPSGATVTDEFRSTNRAFVVPFVIAIAMMADSFVQSIAF